MAKKKIIISGATSAIMNAVIDLVQLKNEYHIIGITTKLQKGQRKDIQWMECNLTMTVNDYAFIKGADTIIHAAAISKAYTLKEYLNINLQSTKTLIYYANKFHVNNFIYISSIVACETCGDYGLSKFLSENYIKTNFTNWLIIRPSQLYGYSEKAPIDSLIKKVSTKQIIPSPIGDPYGLTPLYYLDAARLIFDSIFVDKLSKTIKIIIGPQAFNYKSLVSEIAKNLNRKIFVLPIPKIILFNLRKLIKILGIKAGIYPDQIVRLYNPNKNIKIIENNNLVYLSEYIKQHIII